MSGVAESSFVAGKGAAAAELVSLVIIVLVV